MQMSSVMLSTSFTIKKNVAQHNHKANISYSNAIISCTAAASAESDDAGGLKAVVCIWLRVLKLYANRQSMAASRIK